MPETPSLLVSTDWLAAHAGEPRVKIVDAGFRMPGVTPTAAEAYRAAHIPGATFFDIDGIANHDTSLPHMLPGPAGFAAAMAELGIGSDDLIVLYDTAGIMGAARAWWMLRSFGHRQAVILDGGLAVWRREGRPVTDTLATPAATAPFEARFNPALVRDRGQILDIVRSGGAQIVDARAAARFTGETPEPRAGLRQGHIPGSRNLDHAALIDPATGLVKSPEAIKALFEDAGLDPAEPIVASCGSGVSACVLAFGLALIGRQDVPVYDGSWTEWGAPGPLPIETGPAR
jgi:thiosulfate/3-mercaptopyruvate sulfurtransferase